ncbi:hypothetical protein ABQF35_10905 [Mycobacterium syngnathidarum]
MGPLTVDDDGVLLRARGIRYGRAARFAAGSGPDSSAIAGVFARGSVCPQLLSRLEWVTGPVVAA